jgi:hypothetical protein
MKRLLVAPGKCESKRPCFYLPSSAFTVLAVRTAMTGTILLPPGAAVLPRYSPGDTNAHCVRPLLYFQAFVFPSRKIFSPRAVVRRHPRVGIPFMTCDTGTQWRAERRRHSAVSMKGGPCDGVPK